MIPAVSSGAKKGKQRTTGPTSSDDIMKTKSVAELTGVQAMEFSDLDVDEDEPAEDLSPKFQIEETRKDISA